MPAADLYQGNQIVERIGEALGTLPTELVAIVVAYAAHFQMVTPIWCEILFQSTVARVQERQIRSSTFFFLFGFSFVVF